MGDLIGELIVRSIPVLLPACLVLALLTHWGIIGPSSSSKDTESKGDKKAEKSEKAKEETAKKED